MVVDRYWMGEAWLVAMRGNNYPYVSSHHTMRKTKPFVGLYAATSGIVIAFLLSISSFSLLTSAAGSSPEPSSLVSVFANGLNNPRGLTFGPDGYLYVAEGGTGGLTSTAGPPPLCPQAESTPTGVGPYTGGYTASISKISKNGVVTKVIGKLPSTQWSPLFGSLIQGVADVEFVDGVLYGITAGGGCSHGFLHTPNMVFRVNKDGTYTMIADLSAFLQAHPVAIPDNLPPLPSTTFLIGGLPVGGDFEPDGTWYGMVAVGDTLYATEPNSQQIDKVSLGGQVSRMVDLSTLFVPPTGWQGATAITYNDGLFYFGALGYTCCPPGLPSGYQSVFAVTRDGWVKTYATGFTGIVGLSFDSKGRLYVLETTTGPGTDGFGSNSGVVARVGLDGQVQTIATGLDFPTGLAIGPNGDLFVSNNGYGAPPGGGQIVQIDIDIDN